jgi:hypothetical protein
MGEVGIIRTDTYGQSSNPASLGYPDMRIVSLSIGPPVSDPSGQSGKYNWASARFGLKQFNPEGGSTWSASLGYQYSNYDMGDMVLTFFDGYSWVIIDDDYRIYSHLHCGTLGIRFLLDELHFGLGGAVKYFRHMSNERETDAVLFDIGVLLQIPVINTSNKTHELSGDGTSLAILLGGSVANLGSDIERTWNDYHPPRTSQAALGVTIRRNRIGVLPAYQLQHLRNSREDYHRLGIEIGYDDAVFARTGAVFDQDDYMTVGVGFSAKRLWNLIRGKQDTSVEGLDARFDYAYQNRDLGSGSLHLLEIVVSY